MRIRADLLVVERGLAPSRHKARQMIEQGQILADGSTVSKAGQLLSPQQAIELMSSGQNWVSRGGQKLAHAFTSFALPDITGFICADIGASTGGFCDVLLHYGAGRIYAVDVGHGQLASRIASHPKVVNLEKLNARHLNSDHISEPLDMVVCDVSFISLTKALPAALNYVRPGGHLVTLVKPQFEAGREHIGKKGVVKDPAIHRQVLDSISAFLVRSGDWHIAAIAPSPITGPEGNTEFLLHAVKSAGTANA